MREALRVQFDDTPIRALNFPQELRKASSELDKRYSEVEEKHRSISASSNGPLPTTEEEVKSFLDDREQLADQAAILLKEAKKTLEELRSRGSVDKKGYKRMHQELDESDNVLALERGVLARDRARIALRISADHMHQRLGQAYLMAITDRIDAPANATINMAWKRSGSDNSNFRNKLIKTYNGFEAVESYSLWCPVLRDYVLNGGNVKAAHLVPAAIGETNAAYLFGVDVNEGFDCIWSERNGLLLHEAIEEALDDARLVIIPKSENLDVLSVVLLDQTIKDRPIYRTERGVVAFKDLGDLEFKTEARPGLRNLYFNTLLAIFRRKRFGVAGHEQDFDKLKMADNAVWATPGKWMRRSIVRTLAAEIGDVFTDDMMSRVLGLGDFPNQDSPKEERRRAADMRFGLEYEVREGEEVDGDEDEE